MYTVLRSLIYIAAYLFFLISPKHTNMSVSLVNSLIDRIKAVKHTMSTKRKQITVSKCVSMKAIYCIVC